MTLLVWILLGLIAGFIASHIVDHPSEGIVLDVLLGIIGAFVGGWLFPAFGHTAVTGLNLHSVLVAAVGPSSYCLSIMRWAGNDGIACRGFSGDGHCLR